MEKNLAVVTIFALLFAVSTARVSLHSSPENFPLIQNCNDIKSQPESGSESNSKSKSQPTDQNLKSENDRAFKVDLTPRSDYAKFHTINRHFFDESRIPLRSVHRRPFRHFQNPFMIPRSEISDEIRAFETEKLHRGTPFKRLKSKHDYTHRHHRHQHHRIHRENNNDVKVKNFVHQHKEKKTEREAGNFLKSIRKFLKHSFE